MKKATLFLFALLVLTLGALAQDKVPHPYVNGGLDLMPSGYASLAAQGGVGIMYNLPHLVLDTYAGYDNGRKENDNTLNNYKGHDRFLRGFAGFKQGTYYAGVGARWSQLSTTNYTKGGDAFSAGSWHPEVGGGKDWSAYGAPLFLRTQVLYMFNESKEVTYYPSAPTCYGCGNGSHGADITLWFPSPAKGGHLFFKMNVVLFRFHDSVTEPSNIPLTNAQIANKHFADSTELLLGWKF